MSGADLTVVLKHCRTIVENADISSKAEKSFEAYKCYLECCLKAASSLYTEVNRLAPDKQVERLELTKLISKCGENLVLLCSKFNTSSDSAIDKTPVSRSYSSQPPRSAFTAPQVSRSYSMPSKDNLHCTKRVRQPGNDTDPLILARYQCALVEQHLRERISIAKPNHIRLSNWKIEAEKRKHEIRAIAEKRKTKLDEELIERQQQLKALADQRVADLNIDDAEKKQKHNQILTSILLHDNDSKWCQTLQSQLLTQHGDLDPQKAEEFCDTLFRSEYHPLASLVRFHHENVQKIVNPLVKKYHPVIRECITVPYKFSGPLASDEDIRRLEEERDKHSNTPTFENYCEQTSRDLELAIDMTKDEITHLQNQSSKMLLQRPQLDEIDEMDYLFDDLEVDRKPDSSAQGDFKHTDNQTSCTVEDLNEVETLADTLGLQLEDIVNDTLENIHMIRSLFFLAYKELDSDMGFDIVTSCLYEHLFKDIQPHIELLFRLTNIKKERRLAMIMTDHMTSDISCMKVKDKWCLGTKGECYNNLIVQVESISNLSSPLKKINQAAMIHKGVVDTVGAYHLARNKQEYMGADDMVPIICYIILKSGSPQIVSTLELLNRFIPTEYMIGEEGYCLSTYQVAVEYLLKL